MKKTLKYFGYLIGILLILLVVVPYLIPKAKYKEFIEDQVNKSIISERKFEIAGDVEIRLIPLPTLICKDVKLSSLPNFSSTEFIDIKEVKATLEALSLLKGKIVFSSIQLLRPSIFLEKKANKEVNWWESSPAEVKEEGNTPLTLIKSEAVSSNPDSMPAPAYQTEGELSIKSLKIIDGKIEFLNEGNKKIFDGINLDAGGNEEGVLIISSNLLDQKLKLTGQFEQLDKLITMQLKGEGYYQQINVKGVLDVDKKDFKGDLEIIGDSSSMGIENISKEVNLKGNIEANSNQVELKDIKLDLSDQIIFDGALSYKLDDSLAILNLVSGKSNINAELKLSASSNAKLEGKLKLEVNNGQEILAKLGINSEQIKALFAQPLTLNSDITYNEEDLKIKNVELNLLNTSIRGFLEAKEWNSNLKLNYDFKTENAGKLASKLSSSKGPVYNLSNFQVMGKADKKGEVYNFNSLIKALGSDASIEGYVKINASKPFVNMKVKSSLLDIDKMLLNSSTVSNNSSNKVKASANAPIKINATNTSWSKDKLDFSFLNKFDGSIDLNIAKLLYGNMAIYLLESHADINAGNFKVSNIGHVYEGTFKADTKLSNNGNNLFFVGIVKDINLKSITPQSNKIKITQGKLNGDLTLYSSGDSLLSHISSLEGKANISGKDGVISGVNISAILEALTKKTKPAAIISAALSALKGGETKFSTLVATSDIKNGIADITECKIYADQVAAVTTGKINFLNYNLNTITKIQIKDYPTLDILLSGPLDEPNHKINANSFINHVIKNVFNTVLSNVKEGNTSAGDIIKQIIGIKKDKGNADNEEDDKKGGNKIKDLFNKGKKLFKK